MTGLIPLLLARLGVLFFFGLAQMSVFDGQSVLVDLCHVPLSSLEIMEVHIISTGRQ